MRAFLMMCRYYPFNRLLIISYLWRSPHQWNDIDAMHSRNDFTIDDKNFADLPKFVEHLHRVGMKYIPMFDPGISASETPGTYPPYDLGMLLNIFVKNSTGQPFIGIFNENFQ